MLFAGLFLLLWIALFLVLMAVITACCIPPKNRSRALPRGARRVTQAELDGAHDLYESLEGGER